MEGSFEYPQHMFWMRNKENSFSRRTLIWRPASKHLKAGHHRLAIETPFEWRFAGGPMVAPHCMLAVTIS